MPTFTIYTLEGVCVATVVGQWREGHSAICEFPALDATKDALAPGRYRYRMDASSPNSPCVSDGIFDILSAHRDANLPEKLPIVVR